MHRRLPALALWLAPALLISALALAAHELSPTRAPGEHVAKIIMAAVALTAVLYDRRYGVNIPLRAKQLVAVLLSLAAVIVFFQPHAGGFPAGFHVPDTYHNYIGAKFFPELRYDGIYDCATIAQDEAGRVTVPTGFIDVRADIHAADFYVRDLHNFALVPATEVLTRAADCHARFSPERWARFKHDVLLFRTATTWDTWKAMQIDRGFNASPLWITLARPFTSGDASVEQLIWLGRIDWLYMLGIAAALWWAFGWRTAALATVFWGTQSFVTTRMMGGAFMRLDWLFFLVLALCFARKRRHASSGAAFAVSTALQIFPGLILLGVLFGSALGVRRSKHRRSDFLRFITSAVSATVLIAIVSSATTDRRAYSEFIEHNAQLAKQPVSNHMGLPVALVHGVGAGTGARLEHLLDEDLIPPQQKWVELRAERMAERQPFVLLVAAVLAVAVFTARRRLRPLWRGLAVGSLFLMLLPLTSSCYAFLIGFAPLARRQRMIEPLLLATGLGSTAASIVFWWYDDRFAVMTWIALLFGLCVLVGQLLRRSAFQPPSGPMRSREQAGAGLFLQQSQRRP